MRVHPGPSNSSLCIQFLNKLCTLIYSESKAHSMQSRGEDHNYKGVRRSGAEANRGHRGKDIFTIVGSGHHFLLEGQKVGQNHQNPESWPTNGNQNPAGRADPLKAQFKADRPPKAPSFCQNFPLVQYNQRSVKEVILGIVGFRNRYPPSGSRDACGGVRGLGSTEMVGLRAYLRVLAWKSSQHVDLPGCQGKKIIRNWRVKYLGENTRLLTTNIMNGLH